MRRLTVFTLLAALLALAVASTTATAGSGNWNHSSSSFNAEATSRGWGIPIIFGTDKASNSGKIVAVDCRGKVIAPCDGTWPIPEDAGIVTFYIIPDDISRINKYEIRWGFGPFVQERDLEPTTFDGDVGWRFSVGPEEYGAVGSLRTITLWVKQFDAKHWYTKAIVKITWPFHGSVKTTDTLILTVVPATATSSVAAGPSPEMAAFTAELDARFNKVGAYATNLDQRLTKLENAFGQFIQDNKAQAQSQPAQGACVPFTLNAVYSLQGPATIEVAGTSYPGRSANLCLAPGTYSARAIINGRSSIWVNFNVYAGMKTVNIGEVK